MLGLTYTQLLQTISTFSGLLGAGCAIYATFLAHRIHGTARAIHQTMRDQAPPPRE